MASPLLAMIGAITLLLLGVVAVVALVVMAAQGGYAAAQFVLKRLK